LATSLVHELQHFQERDAMSNLSAHVLIRRLDEDNPQDSTNAPTASPTARPADDSNGAKNDLMAYEKYGIIVLVIVILVFLYFLCRRWKKRRERRALEIDSARADNVLGDMAMVPRYDSDEEDENGDLI
jgi:hypothetical protein